MSRWRIAALTTAAMVAFAANSVLCRLSLGAGLIDATSFTTIRLVSGAACLLAIVVIRDMASKQQPVLAKPQYLAVLALVVYMIAFSFAYLSLSAGMGALLLFGAVQFTMLGTAIYRGERLTVIGWAGLGMAMLGLIYLLAPGTSAPSTLYAGLMVIAGIAWGVYSLSGQNASAGDPTRSTANNFFYATPVALLLTLLMLDSSIVTLEGILYSIASGALASGVGYAIWYTALKHLKSATAATVQLSVPAIATAGGVLFIQEPLTLRIVGATLLTLGGIGITLSRYAKPQPPNPQNS